MFQYNKYNIKTTDRFNPDDFPKVLNELELITQATAGLPGFSPRELLIPFLKSISLKTDWLKAEPSLAALFTAGDIVTTHMSSLFDSCRKNQKFSQEYEDFICSSLSP